MNNGIFKFRVFRRRRTACRIVAVVSAFFMLAVGSLPAFAGSPVQVLSDTGLGGASYNKAIGATITPNGDLSAATILQNGGAGAGLIDWHALNIGAGQSLNFDGAQFFNVVSGGNASQIAGTLTASGQLWIFNPAGVSFLNGANVSIGGLFGVATADLANKDAIQTAIEKGEAIPAPEIASWGSGKIYSADGTTFTVSELMALSKNVDLSGDFTQVGSLVIGAGGKAVVDEVAGGKVSINLGDFLDDADVDGISVELGDIDLGDKDNPTGKQGDLTVATEGSILVKGAIKADGDIVFKSLAGEGASAPVISYKKMSVASGKLLQGKSVSASAAGRVQIDGEIKATGDEAGVDIESGLYTTINGSVTAVKDVVVAAQGNVNVAGAVESTGGSVAISAAGAGKSVKVGWNGSSLATDAVVSGATGVEMTGKISSQVLAGEVKAAAGDVSLSGGEYVAVAGKATAESGNVSLSTTESATLSSDVGGTTYKAGDTAGVLVLGEGQVKASGDVVVNSVGAFQTTDGTSVEAGDSGTLSVNAAEGTDIGGDFTTANMTIAGNEADVTISKEIDITGDLVIDNAANISVESGISANDITFKGTKTTVAGDIAGNDLAVKTADGTANADLKHTAGVIDVNSIAAANIEQTGGTMTAADYIKADGEIKQNGDNATTVMSAKTIEATTVGQTGGKIVASEKVKADVTQSGCEIDTPEIQGNLTQTDASDVATVGKVTGDVLQSAAATLKSSASYNDGNLDIVGKLEQTAEGATVDVSGGKLTLGGALTQTAGTIKADTLNLEADSSVAGKVEAATLDAEGTALTASGDIDATTVKADTLSVTGGTVDATGIEATTLDVDGGTVTADTIAADVEQAGGAVTATTSITGDVTVDGASSTLTTAKIEGGLTQENGTVAADKVTGAAAVTGGTLTASTLGSLEQTGGTVAAKDDALTVNGTTQQSGGTLGDDNDTVTLTGALTQIADGTITADTLNLDADSSVAGKVEAATLDAEGTALTASGDIDATTVKADTLSVTGGTVDATGIEATTLDVDGGTVTAVTIAADVDQDGGAVAATTSITGDVNVDGASSTLTTAKIDGALTQENGTVAADEVTGAAAVDGGTLTAAKLGSLEQTSGEVVAKDDALTVNGTTQQSGGTLGDDNDTVTLTGALTQTADGAITADTLNLEADSSVAGKVEAATLDAEGTALTASGDIDATTVKADTLNVMDGTVDATDITAATLDVDGGTVTADTIAADVDQVGGAVTATTSITGDVNVDGAASTLETAKIDGALTQENGTVAADEVTGAATVNGGTLTASTLGSLEQAGGTVAAKDDALTVNGTTQQSGGTLGDDNDTIMLNGVLTQSGGTIAASVLSLSGGAEQTDPNGTVNADTLVLADSDFNVTLDKGANKIGSVYGRVKNIALKDTDGGLVIGNDMNNLEAEGNVSIETVGDMTEFGGDYGKIVARNGKTTVTSTDGNINLDHGWNMFSEVEATAEQGSVNIVNAIGYDPSNPAAVQNLKVDGATTKNDVRIVSKDTVTIAGAVDATEGNIRLESTKATLDVGAVVSGNNVTLAAANGITENAAVNAAADKYVKSANGDINVNATATVGGDVAYVANKTTGKIVTGDGATIGSIGGGTTYKSDSTGTIAANGSMTSKDGVTTFKDASVVAIDTTDSVVVNNDGVAVTVGEVAGGVSVTEVLADPSGGPAADGTDTVALDSSSASGITAKDVTITVAGAPGDIAVSVEKAIATTDGDVSIDTEKGDVNIQADVVATGGDVIADAGDNVRVKGDVSGENVGIDAGGFAQVNGGKNVSATDAATIYAGGSVTVLGTVEGKTVSLLAGTVDATKSIKVQGAAASVSGTDSVIMTGGKSVQVIGGAKVESDGTVEATADEYIAVNGTVSGKTGVTLETTTKDTLTSAVGAFPAGAPAGVIVQEGTVESAEGAVAVTSKGSVMVDGDSTVSGKSIALIANGEGDGQGIQIAGDVTATGGDVDIDAAGVVTVDNATVAAKGKVLVGDTTTPSGSFEAKNGATVTGLTGVDVNVSGRADVNGATVTAGVVNPDGSIGAGSDADLSMTAGKNVKIEGGATVAASGTATVTANGNDGSTDKNGVEVTGTGTKLVADKNMTVQATTGDGNVVIKDGAYVAARNSADGNETIVSSANGSVEVSGAVTAVEAGKELTITGAKGVTVEAAKVGTDGALALNATGDDASVTVQGGASALGKKGVTVDSAKDVVVDGALVKAGSFTVDESNGNVTAFEGGDNAALNVTAAGNVEVKGNSQVGASGTATVVANGADGVSVASSKVAAKDTVNIDANGGGIVIDKSYVGTHGEARLTASKDVEIRDVSAVVESTGDMTIKAISGDVTVGEDARIGTSGNLEITAGGTTGIKAEGVLVADEDGKTTTLTAENGAIDAQNADNDFQSVTAMAGGNITLNDKDDIVLTKAAATAGDVRVKVMTEKLTVADGTDVRVSGQDIRLEATADAIEVGAGVSGKNVSLVAGMTVTTKKVDGVSDGALTADKGDLYISAGGDVTLGAAQAATAAESGDNPGGVMAVVSGGKIAATGTTTAKTLFTKDASGVEFSTVSVDGMSAKTDGNIKMTFNKDVEVAFEAGGDVDVTADGGTITVASKSVDGGDFTVTEVTYPTDTVETDLATGAGITDGKIDGVTAGGTVTLAAKGEGKDVIVKTQVVGEHGVTLTSENGSVNIGTSVDADAVVKAGKFDIPTAPDTKPTIADGDSANLAITAGNGVTAMNGAKVGSSGTSTVAANGDKGVTFSGSDIASKGAMTISATKADVGSVRIFSSHVASDDTLGLNAAKDVAVSADANVESTLDMTVAATSGNVTVSGSRLGTNAKMTIGQIGGNVEIKESATLLAAEDIDIDATGAVTVDAATVAAKGDVLVGETGDATKRSGSFTAQNDATVTADGNVSVYVNGDAKVDNATVKAGNFTVDANGNVDETASDYTVGNLTIDAGNAAKVTNGAQVGASGTVTVTAKSVEVDASVLAANDNLEVTASGGSVTLETATVAAHGTATLTASADIAARDSTIVAEKTVSLDAGNDVKVEGTTKVGSDDNVVVKAGNDVTVETGAKVLAADKGTADNAISVTATSGDVTVAGEVVASKDGVAVNAGSDIEVSGAVAASEGDVALTADKDDIKVLGVGSVTAQKGDVVATATAGLVDVNGTVKATQTGSSAKGTVSLVGNGADDGDGVNVTGIVEGDLGVTLTAAKDVVVNGGTVKAGKFDVPATPDTKPTIVDDDNANLSIAAGNGVTVQNGAMVGASGTADITADGDNGIVFNGSAVASKGAMTVSATKADTGSVNIDASHIATEDTLGITAAKDVNATSSAAVESTGDMTVAATSGDVTVSGTGTRFGTSGKMEIGLADAKIGGNVEVTDSAKLLADGDVDIDATGAVTVDDATVAGKAGVTIDADGDIDVDGAVVKAGVIDETTGAVSGEAADLTMTAGKSVAVQNAAKVGASGTAAVTANGVNNDTDKVGISVDGEGTQLVSEDNMELSATAGSIAVAGKAYVGTHGTLGATASRDVVVADAGTNVESAEAMALSGANVTVTSARVGTSDALGVTATAGDVTVEGDATVIAASDITVEAADSADTTDVVEGNVTVDDSAVTSTAGNVEVNAANDISVLGTGAVEATAENVALTAANNADIAGTVTSGKGVTIAANGTDDTDGATISGTVTAGETASVTAAQNATVETGATVTGADVAIKATAAKATVAGDVEATTATASVTAGTDTEVSGNVTGDNVMLEAKTGVVLSGSASVTTTGSVDDGNGNLRIHTEDGGITLGAGTTVSTANNVTVLADNGDITQDTDITATAGTIDVEATNGSIVMADGTTSKTVQNGNIRYKTGTEIALSKIDAGTGSVTLDALGDLVTGSNESKVIADGLAVKANKVGKSDEKMQFSVSKLAVNSATDVYVDNDKSMTVIDAKGNDFKVNRVNADGTLGSAQSEDINGIVAQNGDVDLDVTSGILTIDTKVSAAKTANISGDGISFDEDGNVSGADVVLTANNGDITQDDATISATGGYVPETSVNAAVTATGKATLVAANGSIGSVQSGSADYVGVEAGSITANAANDVAIADPNGDGLVVDSDGITGGTAAAVYTAGTITGEGTISAPRLTVSAKSYENGIVKVNVGNTLTVNNFTGGMNPLLAIFESNGGSDRPNLVNLPNKTVVFFDGRLLGGDLQTINTVGSIEAFPVQTPELKSEQGIFGNPTFLHNELDVSNPMAVGAIDFILLEIPRLTLSDDFPLEVERHVAAAGLNPTTTYWFGQSNEASKDEAEGNDGFEPPASGENPDEKGDEGTTPVHTAKN